MHAATEDAPVPAAAGADAEAADGAPVAPAADPDADPDAEAPAAADELELDELHPAVKTATTTSVAPVRDVRRRCALSVIFVCPLCAGCGVPALQR